MIGQIFDKFLRKFKNFQILEGTRQKFRILEYTCRNRKIVNSQQGVQILELNN